MSKRKPAVKNERPRNDAIKRLVEIIRWNLDNQNCFADMRERRVRRSLLPALVFNRDVIREFEDALCEEILSFMDSQPGMAKRAPMSAEEARVALGMKSVRGLIRQARKEGLTLLPPKTGETDPRFTQSEVVAMGKRRGFAMSSNGSKSQIRLRNAAKFAQRSKTSGAPTK